MSKLSRQDREQAGRRAEAYAAAWLKLRGYKVLEMRYKTPDGEIDIIARKAAVLACIEVKQRSDAAQAVEAVTYSSEQRIMDAAEIYVTRNPHLLNEDFELRFDILYVIGRSGLRFDKIDHIKDAFRAY
ncbi:YraN family protein [Litorimonas sp. RW-G-Af-16]|uniref:YraN family protein n=1 Tax=Litorimonas sp. RW-G-Af-16 TaxID=3241168 RepID=UPI00390CAEB3